MPEYMELYQSLSEYKLEIQHSIHTKSNKWNQNAVIFLARQKFTNVLKYILYYTYYKYIYEQKSFSTMLAKSLRKYSNRKEEIEKLENHKLDEMGALNMKQKK